MGVDQDRVDTAPLRKKNIISVFSQHLIGGGSGSGVEILKSALQKDNKRIIIGSLDIDGIVSAMMISSITGWKIGAIIDGEKLHVNPLFGSMSKLIKEPSKLFGVDVYSPLYQNISNHPILFGASGRSSQSALDQELQRFDDKILSSTVANGTLNPSIWAGIGMRLKTRSPRGLPYKYPLGTAQLLLALLEAAGLGPRFFDRQYLPWIVAHCDGGLKTIREYHWNAEMWWSSMAAAVGPSSQSEALYKLAMTQRPTETIDVDRRLRYDYVEHSKSLKTDWNLVDSSPETVSAVTSLLMDLSGWDDPFEGGAENFAGWSTTSPKKETLKISGITNIPLQNVKTALSGVMCSVHASGFIYDNAPKIGWMMPT